MKTWNIMINKVTGNVELWRMKAMEILVEEKPSNWRVLRMSHQKYLNTFPCRPFNPYLT